ncbi:MAG: B12-binding domain-containing protein [Planctomycetota bacterium]|nr:B12-binding domain-containing protein [Planctomycetota bacterium]
MSRSLQSSVSRGRVVVPAARSNAGQEILVERFFETLINGDRVASRNLIREVSDQGTDAQTILTGLCWPTYELIEKLYRADQMTKLSYHLATRILRQVVDQQARDLKFAPRNGRTVFACCGSSESEELAAQIAVDILEAGGFTVTFAGGGLPADEILGQVHERKPQTLLMFASAASDLPGIRSMIDTLHEIGACPNMQFVVGGGVFNRAEGLAEEIGADLWASDPLDLIDLMVEQAHQRAKAPQQAAVRKRKVA